MSPEAQRIAIAEACGYTNVHKFNSFREGKFHKDGTIVGDKDGITKQWIPDYLSDLNAMHEALSELKEHQWPTFLHCLDSITGGSDKTTWWECIREAVTASASELAEAFLRTLNLWRDDA